jgi:H+/Cl- antiporter ClcA
MVQPDITLDGTQHKSNNIPPPIKDSVEVPGVIYSNGEKESLLGTGTDSSGNGYGGTMNSPSSPGNPSRRLRNLGSFRGGNLNSSLTSSLRNSWLPAAGTIIVSDDEVLPPQTPLYGSSKLAANARNNEMKRIDSAKSIRCGKSASMMCEQGEDSTVCSIRTVKTLKEIEEEYLEKARTTFYQDAINFAEGTIPQSIMVAFVIGCVCGFVAYVYYSVLDYLLEIIWNFMPEQIVINKWPEHLYILWLPMVSLSLSVCCGLSIYYLGEPGDLAYTIKCIHEKGYKATHHIIPMIAASMFTILSGASLGPEAPLVAICAATAGFISRKVFKQTNRNVVRKHTFMGMAGALSAFFGVPLGGSLFALEVTSRFGVEYFEHLIEAIFAGEICVTVFRSLAGLPLAAIWANENTPSVSEATPLSIVLGGSLGLLGAGLAYLWANFHWRLMDIFGSLGLLYDENVYAVPRVICGAAGVITIGMLVPQTMFWGEWEYPVLATLSQASDLPHVWPSSGLIGFEMDSCTNCLIVGFCKLVAISFTVAGGFRGGFIFPFFTAGAAFGRALCFVFPGSVSPVLSTLCLAAGINVAITRTALASPLILCYLSGEQFALPAVLSASIASLFATSYFPFIKAQIVRSDIDFSLFHKEKQSIRISSSFVNGIDLGLE